MMFEIITTKYMVIYNLNKQIAFVRLMTKSALLSGIVLGSIIMASCNLLQKVFHIQSAVMFVLFGAVIPLYFLMSVNRGIYPGKNNLFNLSKTYTSEIFSRLLLTIAVILFVPNLPTTIIVASGITSSFLFGLQPFQKIFFKKPTLAKREMLSVQNIATFFALTAFYELTQIIISNSDVISCEVLF